jgi:hypothetical protein
MKAKKLLQKKEDKNTEKTFVMEDKNVSLLSSKAKSSKNVKVNSKISVNQTH